MIILFSVLHYCTCNVVWLLVDKSTFPEFTTSGLGGRFPWPRLALLGLSKCSPDLRSPPRFLFGWSDHMILELEKWVLWWTKLHAVFFWVLLADHGYQNSKTWQEVCKGLMTDPTWNWVFKNTFDAMEEQLNKVSIENFRLAFFWTSSAIWWPKKIKWDLTQNCQIHNMISIFCKSQRIVLHFTNPAGALCSGCPRYIGSIHLQSCVWFKQVPNHIEE